MVGLVGVVCDDWTGRLRNFESAAIIWWIPFLYHFICKLKGCIVKRMHNQLFQLQQHLLQHKGGQDGYPLSGSGVSVPGSTSSYPDGPTDLAYVPPNTLSRALAVNLPPAIRYRPILPSDLEVLKEIHEALFPIKYEPEFFIKVVQGQGIVSWAAVDTNRSNVNREELVGFVTARAVTAPESEESDMLGYEYGNTGRSLIYILTLGVIRPYRNCGIASALVSEVVEYAASIASCRAVYLHVISYNKTAILFYEKNAFHALRKLRNFYYINGQYYDAYLYVFYVNGGRPPCTALDFLAAVSALVRRFFSSVTTRLFKRNMGKRSQKHKDMCGPGSPTHHRPHGSDNPSSNMFV